jgi:hypothetical protein
MGHGRYAPRLDGCFHGSPVFASDTVVIEWNASVCEGEPTCMEINSLTLPDARHGINLRAPGHFCAPRDREVGQLE